MDPTPAPVPADGSGRRPRVAVVFGGRSSEHAISCVTASGVMAALDRSRYDVVPIGITRQGRWVLASDDPARWAIQGGRLPEVTDGAGARALLPQAVDEDDVVVLEQGEVPRTLGAVDVVFPVLHGPFGEDGTLQGMLELSDTRYVGAGVLASAMSMDKHYMKVVLAGHGLPVAPYVAVRARDWDRDRAGVAKAVAALGFPVFVKPARAGSSMGVTKVSDPTGLDAAVEAAQLHDPKVLVEQAVVGREVECAVLQDLDDGPPLTSLPGEIEVVAGHEFYDFEAKYLDEANVRLTCPADLPTDVSDRVRELSARTFDAMACEGLARVDVFVAPDGSVVVNELNTMPGFTPTSMYPRMWEHSGLGYPALVDHLVRLALTRPVGLR